MGRSRLSASTPMTGVTRRVWLAALGVILANHPAGADSWIDTHDEPAAAWRLDTDGGARELAHERVRVDGPQKGVEVGAERIAYVVPPAMAALAWRNVPPAAVIDELTIEIAGRATLPGVRLVAEVTLPSGRSDEPPVRLRLRSEPAPAAAKGEFALELDQLPNRLQREARVWRVANRDKRIDLRGAYVSRVAIVLPGSGRPAQVWVRDLRLNTVVTPLRRTAAGLVEAAPEAAPTDEDSPNGSTAVVGGRVAKTRVTLRGDGFRLDGELYYPRIWRWHGEPLATLASRGVTTVWIDELPTPQLLAEAAHHRLRIFCPPPKSAEEVASVRSWDRVLAWVLKGARGERDIDAGLVEVDAVRGLGPEAQRPVLAHVVEGFEPWSRVADGLLVERPISRVSPGVRTGPPTLSPTTPVFAVVPLEVGPALTAQLDGLLGDGVATTWLPMAEVSAAVHEGLRHGALGMVFTSTERIDAADDATLAAARGLEAINRRLRLIEPWIAGPRTQRPGSQTAGPIVLDRRDVRLLARDSLGPQDTTGSPELAGASRLFRITPAGLTTWSPAALVASPQTTARAGDLLVCNDPRVIRSLRAYTGPTAALAARNLIELADQQVTATEALTPNDRRVAGGYLAEARLAATRRDAPAAYDAAHATMAIVADAQRARLALAHGPNPSSSALAVLPGTLTDHFRMEQLLAASPRGPNRLYGGSFEDIDDLRRHGWRHPPTIEDAGSVELAEADAVHGDHVLRLVSRSAGEGPRIVAPAIELAAGETIEVTGWVRVEDATPGAALVIGDTLGGPELDLLIGETEASTDTSWTPFRLLRAAGSATEITLTLSTRGRLQAEVDGVMIRAIQPLGVARRPTRTAAATTDRERNGASHR